MGNPRYAYVLVSDEKYWNRLCSINQKGKVIAFVRKNQVAPKQATQLLFYIKKPAMQVRGIADFIERSVGNYKTQWKKYGEETCFQNFEEFKHFIKGRGKVTVIRFANLTEIKNPKHPNITASILGSLIWFRGKYINEEAANQLVS